MKNERQRAIAFLFGCIGTRLGLAMLARASLASPSRLSPQRQGILRYGLAVASIAIASGLLFHFLAGTRPDAFEAGGEVWWNTLRPVHAFLYFMFAILAIRDHKSAWMFLLADTILGLVAWITHRFPQFLAA